MLRDESLGDPESRSAILFRRRFRVPYPFFVRLVEKVRQQGWLGSGGADAAGRPGIPLEAKVLPVLHILGRGTVLDDTFFMVGMSESTAWRVLHKFCKCFSQHVFKTWSGLPTNDEELQQTMEAYHRLEFKGAVGSTDVTHLSWNKCPMVDNRSYKGKEVFPTLAYEVSVDPSMHVLGGKCGFAGARNDKTIVRYDDIVVQVRMNK
ncbi:unnamed protein product, partial [Discosporangium mesarthrocarpum]